MGVWVGGSESQYLLTANCFLS